MWTGQKTLGSINNAVHSASSDLERIDQALSELTSRLAENHRDQTHTYEALAKLRLDDLASNQIQSILSHADHAALGILEERQTAIQALEKNTQNLQQNISQQESKRLEQSAVVDNFAQQLIQAEQITQQELETDQDYQQQLQKAKYADTVADRAEEKTAIAEQDRLEKGKPFENDDLFMYLWQRQFGQPGYKANPISRLLDQWVARLCGFAEARKNYWMLLELPKRLQDHAESVRQDAEQELAELQDIEETLAKKHGVPEANSALQQQEEILKKMDKDLQLAEEKLNQAWEERSQFTAGEDSYYQNALNEIANVIKRKDVFDLQRLSNRTLEQEDDHLVARTIDLKEEEKDLNESIHASRLRQKDQMKRLRELEQVRHQFKRNRFDDFRSGFNNGNLIEIALSEFLKGVVNNRELWRMIERSQRHRDVGAWPDFGSGGLGRGAGYGKRRGKTTWHWPGSGGGFRLPRSGGSVSRGRGSGGFRTGGGF
jgi:hypothetical protein